MPGCGLREEDEKLVEVGLNPPLRSGSSRLECFLDDGVESDLDRPVEEPITSLRFGGLSGGCNFKKAGMADSF
jgi:hypothetical protein